VSETSGPDSARFEVKFVAPGIELHGLERWARTHWAGFFAPYPSRTVHNVYFDSYEYRAYAAALLEATEREKLRFRWYGDPYRASDGSVEVKSRRARLGWKLTYPVGAVSLAGVRWSEIRRAIRARLPPSARLRFDAAPFPVLINRYRRRYLLSADHRIRVTLDWDQQIFDQRFGDAPNLERRAPLSDTVVVEFKFRAEDQRLASLVMQGLPVRVSRNSKYAVGVRSISCE
jgi:hypothetical protein